LNNLDLELQELDEKRQMRNLANAVKLADSFSLLFVRCNQRPRQKEIIKELKGQLAEYKIKVIFLENQIEHLLDELEKELGDEKPDSVFVYGLENSFPKADTAAESKFVVTLNHSRNSFKKVLNCPLVLFLPEYALSAIYHGATDFYSIRSGVYLFSAKAEETEQLISQHTSQAYRELEGLLFEERQNRIKTIEELFAEYQSLPVSQRNLDKENRLREKLAELYYISGEYGKAQNLYQEAIEYYRNSKDLILLSSALNNLALVYKNQGENGEAINLFREASELVKETVGRKHPDYAIHLNNLALVFVNQRRYDEAIDLLKEVLEIDRETIGKKHPTYAAHINNLASIYTDQGKYDEAIDLFKEALEINRETIGENHPVYAGGLSNLALIYTNQGRYNEAANLFKEALKIDRETIGRKHPNYAIHLSNLSKLYYKQKKYQEALSLVEEVHQIRLKTLGVNHPDTRDIKMGIDMCRMKLKEKASILVPYKN
jgi:tetratricopeptide (TPR) repeat protein